MLFIETQCTYWKPYITCQTMGSDKYLCMELKQCTKKFNLSSIADSQIQACLTCSVVCAGEKCEVKIREMPLPSYYKVVGPGLHTNLIKWDSVLQEPQRYLPDGKLTVLFAVQCPLEGKTDTDIEDSPLAPPPEIVSCMEKLLTDGQFSDIVLVAGEREFPAHRAILAQRSDVFRAMFDAKMTESRTNRVEIQDMSATAVSNFLTFIYTDSAPNVDVYAVELRSAAEKYNIPRLKAVCEVEMAKWLEVENVIDLLLHADMYNANQLKNAAIQWIIKHAPELIETEAWKAVCKDHPKLLEETCRQFACYVKEREHFR